MPGGASLPPEVHAARRQAYEAGDCDRCAGVSLTPPLGQAGFAAWRKQACLQPKLGQGRRCPKIMLAGSPAELHGVAALQAELGRARREVAHLRGILAQIVRTAGQAGPPPVGMPNPIRDAPGMAEPARPAPQPPDPAGRAAAVGLVARGLARQRPDESRPALTPSGWALAGVLAPAR